MLSGSEDDLIDDVRQRLVLKFANLAPDQVSAAVDLVHARFESSTVRDFSPLLVERRASKELSGRPVDAMTARV